MRKLNKRVTVFDALWSRNMVYEDAEVNRAQCYGKQYGKYIQNTSEDTRDKHLTISQACTVLPTSAPAFQA